MRFILPALVLFSIIAASSCEGDDAIVQKPLKGQLAQVKLALNQPLQTWIRLLGNGRSVVAEDEDAVACEFSAGRFVVTVEFTGTARRGTSVGICARDGEPELTLDEATQIMRSLGLNNPRKMAQDPNFDIAPAADSRTWGEPPPADNPHESSPAYAVFRPKNMDFTGTARVLWIHTRLYLLGG